jgi:hypothetical protein
MRGGTAVAELPEGFFVGDFANAFADVFIGAGGVFAGPAAEAAQDGVQVLRSGG